MAAIRECIYGKGVLRSCPSNLRVGAPVRQHSDPQRCSRAHPGGLPRIEYDDGTPGRCGGFRVGHSSFHACGAVGRPQGQAGDHIRRSDLLEHHDDIGRIRSIHPAIAAGPGWIQHWRIRISGSGECAGCRLFPKEQASNGHGHHVYRSLHRRTCGGLDRRALSLPSEFRVSLLPLSCTSRSKNLSAESRTGHTPTHGIMELAKPCAFSSKTKPTFLW